MNKLFAVLKREYLQAVRKKAFIIMTLIFPVLMFAAMVLPALLIGKGMGQKRIAVLDGTGALRSAYSKPNAPPTPEEAKKDARDALQGKRNMPRNLSQLDIDYVDMSGQDVKTAAKSYIDRLRHNDRNAQLDGVYVIPGDAIDNEKSELSYYSRSATDLISQDRLGRMTNKEMQRLRLSRNGIDANTIDRLTRDVPTSGIQVSKSGEQTKGGEQNFFLAFILAALVVLPSFIYGNDIMRGIVQEKSDRIVEVLVSSLKPFQLLSGKILGTASVGLTQITVWLSMMGIVGGFFGAVASSAGMNVSQFLRPMVYVYFYLFFVLAFLTYVCVYAIGGAICNSEKEAQQFIAPITLVMMVPWFLMFPIIMNPDSKLAVAFSMSPVWGPMTMFVRSVVSEPPLWQLAVSIAVTIATILFFFWVTGKIFRVGILSYGKRPTIPQLWRWMKVA